MIHYNGPGRKDIPITPRLLELTSEESAYIAWTIKTNVERLALVSSVSEQEAASTILAVLTRRNRP